MFGDFRKRTNLICEWCGQKEAEFELAVYRLTEVKTYKRGPSVDGPTSIPVKNIGRGGIFVSVKICEQCLPVTTVKLVTVKKEYTETRVIIEKEKDETKQSPLPENKK